MDLDSDPGLPIGFGPCSNGEYVPRRPSPVEREAEKRARLDASRLARRLGMSRRSFLTSLCGAAATLLAIEGCSREANRADPAATTGPGGTFSTTLPPTSTTEPDVASSALSGEEFVFDVQNHFLEYDLSEPGGPFFGSGFPQADCGEDDPRACFTRQRYLENVFVRSDTSMAVLSALPIAPQDDHPFSIEVMEETRRALLALCRDERVLLHGQAMPNVGDLDRNLAAMEEAAAQHPISAWKVYTHFAPPGSAPFLFTDPLGEAMIRKAVDVGVPRIATHKGFSGGSPFASPVDIGPAAKAHPDVDFIVYHSGYEAGGAEGPYDPGTADVGINRLITSLRDAGIGPGQNVYAELGSTWWSVMRNPMEAAHVVGKLLRYVGVDNVVWGTDSIWYGSPQDQIQAFRAFEITDEFQERFGYPPLTAEVKAKVLGLNGAHVYGIDPDLVPCPISRADLEGLRPSLIGSFRTYGPRTPSQLRAVLARQGGWP